MMIRSMSKNDPMNKKLQFFKKEKRIKDMQKDLKSSLRTLMKQIQGLFK